MGRLTTPIGIRLGKTNFWSNNGIVTKKNNCLKYLYFLNNITGILSWQKKKKKKKIYILAKTVLVEIIIF